MNSVAVMQPYLFPYLGYFQLLQAADKFVFFDDVDFIKKGWIHRNSFLVNHQPKLFSVPLSKASQNKPIFHTEIHKENYEKWWGKFSTTLQQNYSDAPYFSETFPLVNDVFENPGNSIADLSISSIKAVADFLGVKKDFYRSSDIAYNKVEAESGQEKIIAICNELKVETYFNMIDGMMLYNEAVFQQNNLTIKFLQPELPNYVQGDYAFKSHLSIIDVLMYNSKNEVREMLNLYELKTKNETYGTA